MKNELISVIVAIYKVEQWLPRCIDSILAQTHRNIELILVDDGSPDNCGKLCDDYAKKDARIRVIHKENGGQSTARNSALDIAQGDYIGFIDGDDWIEPTMYEVLLSHLKAFSVDIVQCGCYRWIDGNVCKDVESRKQLLLSSDEALDALTTSAFMEINTSVCCKLFTREVIGHIRFSPVRAYEDDEFVFRTVGASHYVLCIPSWQYYYNQRENSTMTAKFSLNRIALVTIQERICDYVKERRPQLFYKLQKALCSKQFYILHCLLAASQLEGSKDEASRIYGQIMSSYREYMDNPLMGNNKLMLLLLKYTPAVVWRNVLNIKFR